MRRISGMWALVLISGILIGGSAWSQDKRESREREALRRAQQQVQQARQEKAALDEKLVTVEQEKATLASDKEKLSAQLSGARARAKADDAKRAQLQLALDAVTAEKLALQSQKGELEQRLAQVAARLERTERDLTARQQNTERELAQTVAQKKQVESALEGRTSQVASCEDKNALLYRHGRELIQQCTDRSRTDVVLRLEPFTGIKRVQLENVLEEYRDKLDAQKLLPSEAAK